MRVGYRRRRLRPRAQAVAHEARLDALAEQVRALDPTATVTLYRPTPLERSKARADAVLGIRSVHDVDERPPYLQAHHDADVLLEEADALDGSPEGQPAELAATTH